MSDTNRVRVAVAKTAAQTIPLADAAPPTGVQSLKQLRITGTPNLGQAPQTTLSNEIRPDREVADLILTGVEAGGDVGFEQSFGALDEILEGVLFNTWNSVESGTVSSSTGAVATIAAAGNWADNQIVRVEGLTSGDGVYLIASGGGTTALTLEGLDGSTPSLSGAGTIKLAGLRVLAATADLSVTGGIGTLTLGVNLATAVFGTQAAGDWIQVGPSPGGTFDNAENAGLFRLSATPGATTVTIEAPNGVTEDFDENIDVFVGERLRPGSVSVPNSSFVLERAFTDHENDDTTGRYTREVFVGMAINVWAENLTPASIATATATFFGLRAFARRQNNASQLYANTDLQALAFNAEAGSSTGLESVGANQVYNTASSVARVGRGSVNLVDPAVTKNLVNELSLNINNNLRRRLAVGRFGTASIGIGELNATGTLQTYFDDLSIYEDILTDGFRTAINYALRDGTGRAVLTDLPNVAFSEGAPDVPGKNQDTTIPIGYQALRDATLGYSIHKTRFEYLADV